MRWVKLTLVVGWLGVHALLWTLLPPVPRLTLPADGHSSLIGFTANGSALVTRNATHVRVWDVAIETVTAEWPEPDPNLRLRYLTPHGRTVVAEDTTRDSLVLLDLETGERTEVPAVGRRMYDKDADKLFWRRECEPFSPDGQTLAYAAGVPESNSFVVRLWDITNRTASDIRLERRGFSPVYAPNGQTLAVWVDGQDQAPSYVLLVDAMTKQEVARLATPPSFMIRLAFSPDGQKLAVSGVDPSFPAGSTSKSNTWFQLWDVSSRTLILVARNAGLTDWSAEGGLLVAEESELNAFDGRSGAAVAGWNAPNLTGRSYFRGTFAGGRVALVVSTHSTPPWRNWLVGKGILSYKYFEDWRVAIRLYNAQTGRERSAIWTKNAIEYCVSPDGGMLATLEFEDPFDREGMIYIWDIPPRTPGGIVLGLMIVEVGLLIAWTAWRRRRLFQRTGPGPTSASLTLD